MKLLYTKRSPYARKVRVLAVEKGVALELIEEDLTKKSSRLLEANPLGKIPALVLDNGKVLVDSPVICEYIDGLEAQPVLIPREGEARFQVLQMAAVADGLMDVAVAGYMEKARHPNDPNAAFLAAQEETAVRTLRFFEAHARELKKLSLASIAVACAVGYIQFRMGHVIKAGEYPGLMAWFGEFSKRPGMAATQPVA